MKKLLMMVLLMTIGIVSANAQEVYKEVLRMAEEDLNNPKSTLEMKKIATFKIDELSYMAMKVRDDMMSDTTNVAQMNEAVKLLNEQAVALYEFITIYLERLGKTKKVKERELVNAHFKKISIENPLFNDMDKELVLSYFDNPKSITQFSLDTDWLKAVEEAKKK